MSLLEDIYGSDVHEVTSRMRALHILDTLASNLVEAMELRTDTTVLWADKVIRPDFVKYLCKKVNEINPKIFLVYADCDTVRTSLPYIIRTPMIEYFILMNGNSMRQYIIYITPEQMSIM